MIAALYILLALLAVGTVLWLLERRYRRRNPEAPTVDNPDTGECCGMHITCERDSLLASVSDQIVYYDDEELDAYRGRTADNYSEEEIEQFRDVLLTLLPDDIAGWGRSIQLRGITLPSVVRDELLLIVAETRAERAMHEGSTTH